MEKLTTKTFIERVSKIFPDYDYSETIYTGSKNYVIVRCIKHNHIFKKHASQLLRKKASGCPLCAFEKISNNMKKPFIKWLQKAQEIHKNSDGTPKYDYSESEKTYFDSKSIVNIKCPIHGIFKQRANNHIFGRGCPKCGDIQTGLKQQMSFEEFKQRAEKIHCDENGIPKYLYNKDSFGLANITMEITCKKHNYTFKQTPGNHLKGAGCKKCSCDCSKAQLEIENFIKSNISNNIISEDNKLIKPLTLDIYIPGKQLAIEYNGLYWHSDYFKQKNYHLQKTNECEKKGIQLIHIFEDEWLEKQEIVKARLLNLLGKNKWSIGARKCKIKQVPVEEERVFLNNNHLQGYVASTVCYGLYYSLPHHQDGTHPETNKEYLVALMSFGPLRKNLGLSNQEGSYELYRFVTIKNFSIPGGASRLFKYFIKKFSPKQVISFADRRWSIRSKKNLYEQLGFKFDSYTEPGYFYIQGNKRINRFSLRKDILIKKYGCSELISEREFCEQQGWSKIYDSGQLKYIYKLWQY